MNSTENKSVDLLDEDEADALDAPQRPRHKGIYLLPNLFTLAALFSGFYAIVMGIGGRFEQSVYGIFAAMVLDSLDGRVARMTNTQSTFGEQMDSLSDMVSFGAAPALIMYSWALQGLGKWGWFAAFVYIAGAEEPPDTDKPRVFQGVPSPAAAALVMSLIWALDSSGYKDIHRDPTLAWLAFGFTLYAGLTMVTNAPFYSFKDITFKRSVPFIVLVVIMLAISAINIDPPRVLFGVFCAYGISGYVVYAVRRAKGKPASVIEMSTDVPDEAGLHR